ncbi:hypothetical protein Godav_025203 [Gossypium davidsonii]|uniref:DUF7745 domain-containing protein n=1 Tax=Gossypium davidsonii TaxID=34287 RepID=A0A7J8T781_GOSDV|nr:hypothetical protein [Gossypium davidsonii]
MRPSGYGLRQRSKRRVIVLQRVDKHLFRALAQNWNPTYSCFTFGNVDLVPTMEEYMTLLRCPKIQIDKAYSPNQVKGGQ